MYWVIEWKLILHDGFWRGSEVKVAQSCLTLCEPMDYTVHGIPQARILEWVAFPFSTGSSQPRSQIGTSCTAGGFFTNWATREARKRLVQFSSVQSLSRVWLWLFVTPWTATHQASLSITNSQSLPKPVSIESMMTSNHHILCHPLLLLLSIFPSIEVFSNKSALCSRWPKYWSFSFNISPSSEYPGLICFRMN